MESPGTADRIAPGLRNESMINPPHRRAPGGHLPRFAAALAAALLAACAGPERTPHQPIKGVDSERHEVQNPHDTTRPTGEGREDGLGRAPAPDFLDGFVDEVAAAQQAQPGIIAVFPAFTQGDRGSNYVTRLGELLMRLTDNGLERRGVTAVISGAGLQNDLLAANRGLDSLRGPDDVFWLGERIGAAYVVYGTAQKQAFDASQRDLELQIDWQCKRTSDRATVAAWRQQLTGGELGRELARQYGQESSWKIGDAAAPFIPSLGLETQILARALAQRLAAAHADDLRGKTLHLDSSGTGQAARLAVDAARSVAQQLQRSAGAQLVGTADDVDYTVRGTLAAGAESYALTVALVDRDGKEIAETAAYDPQFAAPLKLAIN